MPQPACETNRFMSCSVHLQRFPPEMLQGDPPALHGMGEAIAKIHRFCHEIYQVPITWLCTWAALQEHGETLAAYHRQFGDEVAIMEAGILTSASLGGEVARYQGWVEECGLVRPDAYASSEPELANAQGFQDMPWEQQSQALAHLKAHFDAVIGQTTRTLACPHTNGDTVRAMRNVGLDVLWGYCWNYFCEGINNKGCLPHPFYAAEHNRNVPAAEADERSVLTIQWGPGSLVIATNVETHARMGQPGYCLNALELANRSEGHDKFRYHERVITEWLGQSRWNPFVHLPLQLEALWFDEGPELPQPWYDQYPRFNPANFEVFQTEIETGLRLGAQPMTVSGFADWHRENVGDTSEVLWHSEDPLPDLRSKGKDQPYQPMVVRGDKRHQYWFMKSHGFNYVRKYTYDPQPPRDAAIEEYPFETEPKVYLHVRKSVNLCTGIVLTPDSARYEVAGFDLTAYAPDPTYAAILWEANIPAYISDADLELGGAVTGFRSLREHNAAIVNASLEQGLNRMSVSSNLPGQHVRLETAERIGRRFELWIRNDADAVELHTLQAVLEPGLRIGGFWWDGLYSHSLYRYGWGTYDRNTGGLEIRCFYPVALPVREGLTRVSIELL